MKKFAHETIAPAVGQKVVSLYCGRPVGVAGKPETSVHVVTKVTPKYVFAGSLKFERSADGLKGFTTDLSAAQG